MKIIMNMEVTYFSEMLVTTYKTTLPHNTKDHDRTVFNLFILRNRSKMVDLVAAKFNSLLIFNI